MFGSEGAKSEPACSIPSNNCANINYAVYATPKLERIHENLPYKLEDSPTHNDGEGIKVDS
jgi:hypothetical protein